MDIEQAIRTRRTHKAFGPQPVERKTLDELFELARWAPNHHGTNPWRFRVLGRGALARLKQAAAREDAAKLDRAPTLIVVSAALVGDALQDEEDLHATAIAAYIVLLVAHARGFAGYWRTPAVLRTPGAVPPSASRPKSTCLASSTSVRPVSKAPRPSGTIHARTRPTL